MVNQERHANRINASLELFSSSNIFCRWVEKVALKMDVNNSVLMAERLKKWKALSSTDANNALGQKKKKARVIKVLFCFVIFRSLEQENRTHYHVS